jgi:hypothetical protein
MTAEKRDPLCDPCLPWLIEPCRPWPMNGFQRPGIRIDWAADSHGAHPYSISQVLSLLLRHRVARGRARVRRARAGAGAFAGLDSSTVVGTGPAARVCAAVPRGAADRRRTAGHRRRVDALTGGGRRRANPAGAGSACARPRAHQPRKPCARRARPRHSGVGAGWNEVVSDQSDERGWRDGAACRPEPEHGPRVRDVTQLA